MNQLRSEAQKCQPFFSSSVRIKWLWLEFSNIISNQNEVRCDKRRFFILSLPHETLPLSVSGNVYGAISNARRNSATKLINYAGSVSQSTTATVVIPRSFLLFIIEWDECYSLCMRTCYRWARFLYHLFYFQSTITKEHIWETALLAKRRIIR